MLGLQQGL